jgi:hypothetical protein
MKNILFEIEELLRAGCYPIEIVKRVPGATMKMVLDVEEDLYQLTNPRSFGSDYE